MKILIGDDHPLFRGSIKQLLESITGVIVTEAGSLDEIYALTSDSSYSVLLLDLKMPGMNGVFSLVEVVKSLKIPIIIISADESITSMKMAQKLGVAGYLPKSLAAEEIKKGVSAVIKGERCFPLLGGKIVPLKINEKLSNRQIQVLDCLINGLSNKNISEKLSLSEGTVKQYVSIILEFLEVDNRTQAAMKAKELFGAED